MMIRLAPFLITIPLIWSAIGAAAETLPAKAESSSQEADSKVLRQLVDRICHEYGVNRFLIDAMVRVESGYNPRAVSRKGAMGLMQLMPDTARYLRVTDPFDPEQNVRAGVRYFAHLLDYYAGDLPMALAAYNAGRTAVDRYNGIPPYRETRTYVTRIMSIYTGKPYKLPGARRNQASPQVRLLRNPRTGEVLITNDADSSRSRAQQQIPRGILGGGFQSQR
jgi:soluble lytic murein transglycosylase-like protein